ncbi:MAG: hypothetical protein JMDDDDMK_00734 [Acidobacteria bacterium]|nr:hypothetical protein [Acidobacteriota bacterium]
MIAKATLQPALSAAEAWRALERERIGLTCALDGQLWLASVERVKRKGRFTRADLEIVSATGSTPLAAVRALIEKLGGAQSLF